MTRSLKLESASLSQCIRTKWTRAWIKFTRGCQIFKDRQISKKRVDIFANIRKTCIVHTPFHCNICGKCVSNSQHLRIRRVKSWWFVTIAWINVYVDVGNRVFVWSPTTHITNQWDCGCRETFLKTRFKKFEFIRIFTHHTIVKGRSSVQTYELKKNSTCFWNLNQHFERNTLPTNSLASLSTSLKSLAIWPAKWAAKNYSDFVYWKPILRLTKNTSPYTWSAAKSLQNIQFCCCAKYTVRCKVYNIHQ